MLGRGKPGAEAGPLSPGMHSCRLLSASCGSCLAPFRYSLTKKKKPLKNQKPTLPQACPGLPLNHPAFCQSHQLNEFTERLYCSRRDLAQGDKEEDGDGERSPVRQRAIKSAHSLIAPKTHYLEKSLFWNWGQKLACDWEPEQRPRACLLSASQISA